METAAQSSPSRRPDSRVVVHIAESFSSGVASAIDAFVEAQPNDVDAVVYGFRIPGVQLQDDVDLPVPFFDLPSGKLRQLLAIRSIIAKHRPDVIHLHSSWAGLFGRIVPIPAHTRIVFTPHCWGFQRLDLPVPVRWAIRKVDRLLGRRTDVVLACSVREAELAVDYRLGRSTLHLPQRLPGHLRKLIASVPRRTRRRGEPLVVGMSGRICPQKGVDFFATVARGIRATPEGRDGFRFKWIGGGGNESDTAALLAAGVEVTGWLSQDRAVEELGGCDIYLHTAAWEGYPMTVLEAFEFDMPVVARAIPAMVSEPREALLVPDPGAAISELLRMADEWPVTPPIHAPESIDDLTQILSLAYYGSQSTS